jgi:hypothetical protein
MIKAVLNDPTKLGTAFADWTSQEMDPRVSVFPKGATLWKAEISRDGWSYGWIYRIYETPSADRETRLPSTIFLDSPWEAGDSATRQSEFLNRAKVILIALGIGENEARGLMVKIGNQLPLDVRGEAEHTIGPYKISAVHLPKSTLGWPEMFAFEIRWEPGVDVTAATPTPANTPSATWNQIAQWSGRSIKDTETFQISSGEWRISWDTQPGEYGPMNFQIYVYKADGTLHSVAANVIGADKNWSIIRGAGPYYLSINSGQPYTVSVEARP